MVTSWQYNLNLPVLVFPVTSLYYTRNPLTCISLLGIGTGRVWVLGMSAQFSLHQQSLHFAVSLPLLLFSCRNGPSPTHTNPFNPNPTRSSWIAESRKTRQSICNVRLSLLSHCCCSSSSNPARTLFLEYSTGLLSDEINLYLHSSFHTCTQQQSWFVQACMSFFPINLSSTGAGNGTHSTRGG